MTKLGYQIPNFTAGGVTNHNLFATVSASAQAAEGEGADTIFVMDHFYQLPDAGDGRERHAGVLFDPQRPGPGDTLGPTGGAGDREHLGGSAGLVGSCGLCAPPLRHLESGRRCSSAFLSPSSSMSCRFRS